MASYEALDDVLHALVEMTTNELGAERGSLFLNDPGDQRAVLAASRRATSSARSGC